MKPFVILFLGNLNVFNIIFQNYFSPSYFLNFILPFLFLLLSLSFFLSLLVFFSFYRRFFFLSSLFLSYSFLLCISTALTRLSHSSFCPNFLLLYLPSFSFFHTLTLTHSLVPLYNLSLRASTSSTVRATLSLSHFYNSLMHSLHPLFSSLLSTPFLPGETFGRDLGQVRAVQCAQHHYVR